MRYFPISFLCYLFIILNHGSLNSCEDLHRKLPTNLNSTFPSPHRQLSCINTANMVGFNLTDIGNIQNYNELNYIEIKKII